MDVANDIVCCLIQTPFVYWKESDKKDLLSSDNFRPTPCLNVCTRVNRPSGKSFNIHFKNTWYSDHKWLCGSLCLNKLYCWPCLLVGVKTVPWNGSGFDDFANTSRSLHIHADSAEHLKCVIKFKMMKNQYSTNLETQTSSRLFVTNFNENVRLNRLVMKTVIRAVLFLAKQGMAFREHDESVDPFNRGNFQELLSSLLTVSTEEVRNHYDKIKHGILDDSKKCQKKVLECVMGLISDNIGKEISSSSFFAYEVVDTTDINQVSQRSVILRYVNVEGKLVERFLRLNIDSTNRTAEELFRVLTSTLRPFAFDKKLISQSYDGASVRGHLNDLQMKIKEAAPQALFIHCLTHRLNSILQQSFSQKFPKCRIFFATLRSVSNFFHNLAKQTYFLFAKRIPTALETRWSSNSKVLASVFENWDDIRNIFYAIKDDPNSDSYTACQAVGFLNNFNDFEFAILCAIFYDIFSVTDILYEILQNNSLDINLCSKKIRTTIDMIVGKRDEDCFLKLFNDAKQKIPDDMKHGRQEYNLPGNKLFNKYKTLFYGIVRSLTLELKKRFQHLEKIRFVALADTKNFKTYRRSFPLNIFQNLFDTYPDIFKKKQRLKNELEILYSDQTMYNLPLQTVVSHLRETKLNEDVFEEVYLLFCLVLTLPSTSSIERNSSCLKRLKAHLRNTTSQQKFPALTTIALEKGLLHEIEAITPFYDDIVDRIALSGDGTVDLTYKSYSNRLTEPTDSVPQDDEEEFFVGEVKAEPLDIIEDTDNIDFHDDDMKDPLSFDNEITDNHVDTADKPTANSFTSTIADESSTPCEDEDKAFLLSLLPTIKGLNDQLKREFKTIIIDELRRFSSLNVKQRGNTSDPVVPSSIQRPNQSEIRTYKKAASKVQGSTKTAKNRKFDEPTDNSTLGQEKSQEPTPKKQKVTNSTELQTPSSSSTIQVHTHVDPNVYPPSSLNYIRTLNLQTQSAPLGLTQIRIGNTFNPIQTLVMNPIPTSSVVTSSSKSATDTLNVEPPKTNVAQETTNILKERLSSILHSTPTSTTEDSSVKSDESADDQSEPLESEIDLHEIKLENIKVEPFLTNESDPET